MRVLVIDNYDSFVYNLVQYVAQLGVDCEVRRNDAAELAAASLPATLERVDGVLVSPGPGTPERAGYSIDVIRRCARTRMPVLGVCLGHQAIAAAWGAIVERAPELLHGKTSLVRHTGVGVLAGLPDPFAATRYHSLAVRPDSIPAEFEVTGWTDSVIGARAETTRIVMAMRHRELPIEGVQFHPESVLTVGGHRMLANWLAECGAPVDEPRVVELESQLRQLSADVS